MKMHDVNEVGNNLCKHYDRLPTGIDQTYLRIAMRLIAWEGHLGCRQRLDSVSFIGEVHLDDDGK